MPHADPLAHALDLLDRVPLIDGHNDLPWVLRQDREARGDVVKARLDEARQGRDTDIPRLKAGRVAAQFWAAFIPTKVAHPARTTLEQIDLIRRMNAAYPDVFLPALRPGDVKRAKRRGMIASFIGVEGGVGLENSLDMLRVFYDLGARYMTLCHNETIDWVDSTTDEKRHGGLTPFGEKVIAEMNRLGLMIDLSHTSHDAMRRVLDISRAPVLFTHCNAFSLCDHPRNVPDDVLERIPANGGIVMATFVPDFVSQRSRDWMRPLKDEFGKSPLDADHRAQMAARRAELGPWSRASIPEVCDHIDYMAAKAGIRHVGIGSDFFGGPAVEGLEDVGRFPHLFAELIRRGWSDEALAGLAGGNFLRVFRQSDKVAAGLRKTETPAIGRLDG
jgi:membrane dipeptidase